MKHLTLSIFIFLFITNSNAQQAEWATSIGGTSSDYGYDAKVDVNKNVYTLGEFNYTADLDPGPGTLMVTSAGNNGADIFLVKQDSSGNLIWVRQMGGTNEESGTEIAIDDNGNVYLAGYFQFSTELDPGPGTNNLTSAGMTDIFISKLDYNGNFVWARRVGGAGVDTARAISLDNNGNIYVTGVFSNTVDFDPGSGVFNFTSNGGCDIFILKLDTAGNFKWARPFGGPGEETAASIECINDTSIAICGGFQDSVDFNPGPGNSFITASGALDIYIMSVDSNANCKWVYSASGTSGENARSVSSDSDGNIYATGIFYDTVDFDPSVAALNITSLGSGDIFILKLDLSGNFLWVKQIGAPATANSSRDMGTSLSVSENNNLFITGQFYSPCDFDPGPGVYNLSGIYGSGFICKLDSAGIFQYATHFEGGDGGLGFSIDTDQDDAAYITGVWWGSSMTFFGNVNLPLTGHGSYDSFTVKYEDAPVGLQEKSQLNSVKLFPNPTNDIIYIQTPYILENIHITITDVLGKIIFTEVISYTSEFKLELNMDPGIYMVNLLCDKESKSFKVIKESRR